MYTGQSLTQMIALGVPQGGMLGPVLHCVLMLHLLVHAFCKCMETAITRTPKSGPC